ncbi:MAG: hypothetical protein WAU11_13160 [Ignavibacteriaceae bacterium]
MVKRTTSKVYESVKHKDFIKVAANFKDAAELAFDFEYYNASGVLFIHSSIAYSDAITIKLSGKKCSGDNHYEVIQLIEAVVPTLRKDKIAINKLKSLIDHKNFVSYTGDIYTRKDLEIIRKAFNKFRLWAEKVLEVEAGY